MIDFQSLRQAEFKEHPMPTSFPSDVGRTVNTMVCEAQDYVTLRGKSDVTHVERLLISCLQGAYLYERHLIRQALERERLLRLVAEEEIRESPCVSRPQGTLVP